MAVDLLELAHSLSVAGKAFALATVVRCEAPTSAKAGAKALITPDGKLIGWVGGSCAEPVVVREALRTLHDGRPRFIALVGDRGTSRGGEEGLLEHIMTCHSGGTLEIYVEPVLPKPQLLLIGQGPVVETLAKLGQTLEFSVTVVASEAAGERLAQLSVHSRTSIVVAGHGSADQEALERVLGGEAGYMSLVASKKRAGAIIEALRARGVPADQLSRVKAPAGLDIGAVTPEEIAVSILAEIIQVSRSQKAKPAEPPAEEIGAIEARDPVCGMSVVIASARYRLERFGRTFYFCCPRCQQTFDQDPQRFLASATG